MKKTTQGFIVIIILQLIVLFGMVGYHMLILKTGTLVTLKVQPVDPTDLFRGDYLIMRYDISQLHKKDFATPELSENLAIGDDVYVPIKQEGIYWVQADKATLKPAKLPNNELYIKGTVENNYINYIYPASFDNSPPPRDVAYKNKMYKNEPPDTKNMDRTIELNFGTENYFIPQNKGASIDWRYDTVTARLRISKNGGAVLEQLLVNDKMWP